MKAVLSRSVCGIKSGSEVEVVGFKYHDTVPRDLVSKVNSDHCTVSYVPIEKHGSNSSYRKDRISEVYVKAPNDDVILCYINEVYLLDDTQK